MKKPKTVKGYMRMLRQIERMTVTDLKGYDEISPEFQHALGVFGADIGNLIADVEDGH